VIDDGSTDGTAEALKSYGARVNVLRQQNQGPEVARNKAARVAQGEYLVFLDSDDLLSPCALMTYDRIIREFNSPPLIIGSMTYFTDGQKPPLESADAHAKIAVYKFEDYLAKEVSVGLSSSRIVLPKSLFDQVGGLRNSTSATFHLDDFNLILKVGTYGPCMVVEKPFTVAYRAHEANSIRSVQSIVNGICGLIDLERSGKYPGGVERKLERYAFIGGIASLWVKYAWKGGQRKLALKLMKKSAPMLAATLYRKSLRVFHHAAPIVLSDESKQ
jgi:glycosyltransferase involved in cell wall biosynthesis